MRNRRFTGFKKMVSLLGADYDIMSRARSSVQTKFYFSAVIIISIFVTSCFSIGYAVGLLFHSIIVEVVLSLFLSSLFVCIYIFLVQTFAKKQLGKEVTKKTFGKSLLNASNFLRTGFIVFIAFLISKPIEVYLFQPKLVDDVQAYKVLVLAQHREEVEKLFEQDIDRIAKRKSQIEQLQTDSVLFGDEKVLTRKLDSINYTKQFLVDAAEKVIGNSDFFIYQVKTVMSRYNLSYLVCGIVILLFLLPGYLIYTLSEDDEYYELKKRVETALVLRNYHSLLKTYKEEFHSRYNVQVQLYTVYDDPPFNTKRKVQPSYQSQEEFFKKFSG